MGKGFSRLSGAAVAVAGVLAGFLLASGPRLSQEPRIWWDVSLTLTVKGDYTVKDAGSSFKGDFSYAASWAGTMERDGEDYLLYHLETSTLGWEARETGQPAKGSPVLTEKEAGVRPLLKLNYILRQGKNLEFDFVVESIPIPLAPSAGKYQLFLPCSREHVRDRSHLLYNEFVSGGSNGVAIPEDALAERLLEKTYSWQWKRQGWVLQEEEPVFVSSRHRAEVTVCLVPHEEFRPGDGSGRRRGGAVPG